MGAPWKTWLEYYGKIPNIQHLFECNLAPGNHMMLLNNNYCKIWNNIIHTWCQQNYESHIYGWNKTLTQVIWLNSEIVVNGKPPLFRIWYLQGVVYISDLIQLEEKRFLTFHEVSDKWTLHLLFARLRVYLP